MVYWLWFRKKERNFDFLNFMKIYGVFIIFIWSLSFYINETCLALKVIYIIFFLLISINYNIEIISYDFSKKEFKKNKWFNLAEFSCSLVVFSCIVVLTANIFTRFGLISLPESADKILKFLPMAFMAFCAIIITCYYLNDRNLSKKDFSYWLFAILTTLLTSILFFLYLMKVPNISIIFYISCGILCLALIPQIIGKFTIKEYKPSKIYFSVGCIALFVVIVFYLLYIAKQEQIIDNFLFSYLNGIFIAILGGGLTLGGVAWTIRHQEKIRIVEDKLKYKPQFSGVANSFLRYSDEDEKVLYLGHAEKHYSFKELDDVHLKTNECIYTLCSIKINNTDNSNFRINAITLNGKDCFIKNYLVKKDDDFIISGFDYIIGEKGKIPEVKIYVEDFLNSKYTYILKLDTKIINKGQYCGEQNPTNGDRQFITHEIVELKLESIKEE